MTANEAHASEVLTTGEAAAKLGLSVKEVRALCEAGELAFHWSRAHRVTKDRNGFELRGHRKIFADSVRAYAKRLADLAAREADAKSPSGNS